MKLLITGATGFLGSYLSKALCKEEYEIVIAKRSFSDISRIREILPHVRAYDVDRVSVKEIFNREEIDVVVHSATNYGKGPTPYNQVYNDNVVFPLQLLEGLRPHATFVNTDTFFNHPAAHLYEYMNSYSLSKMNFLDMAKTYASQNSLRLINVRIEHLYGPLDDPSKFTVNIIKQLLDNRSCIELTPGQQQRDFIYVDDAVSAYQVLLRQIDRIEPPYAEYQVGTGQSYSIKHFVTLAKKITNSDSELLFGKLPYRQHELLHSKADTQALREFGWRTQIGLAEGIERVVSDLQRKEGVQ